MFPSNTLCPGFSDGSPTIAITRAEYFFFQSSQSLVTPSPSLWLGIEAGLLIVRGHAETGYRVYWDWRNGCKIHSTYRSTISPLSFSILAGLVLGF